MGYSFFIWLQLDLSQKHYLQTVTKYGTMNRNKSFESGGIRFCLFLLMLFCNVSSFAPLTSTTTKANQHARVLSSPFTTATRVNPSQLYMSYNENNRSNFDLSKPTFDLFSLRTIRNDALLQYNGLTVRGMRDFSEPLPQLLSKS